MGDQVSFPLEGLIRKHRPDCLHGDDVLVLESIFKKMSLDSVRCEVTIPEVQSDDETFVPEYDSEEESKTRSKVRKLVDQLHVPRARAGHPQTKAYPFHCPVETCRKRFPDSGHLYEHWRRKLHDGDRNGREKSNTEGLLTGMDNCAWDGTSDDDTVCPNCELEKKLKADKQKQKDSSKTERTVIPRKRRRTDSAK